MLFCLIGSRELLAAPPALNELYNVGHRQQGWTHGKKIKDGFLDHIQPILSTRCVSCHGCYEAPCQLNLQSYEGLRRGYHPTPIFSSKRVDYTKPTRMTDASAIESWRALGFLPVTSHAKETNVSDQAENYKESLLSRFLSQSAVNNGENFPLKDLAQIQDDYNGVQKHACVATSSQFNEHFSGKKNEWGVVSFEDFVNKHPNAGMPFGLTRLNDDQEKAMAEWLEKGSQGPSPEAQALLEQPTNPAPILAWEAFFNQPSTKAQQTARYLYEHVFSAILHFDENPGEYFELVRYTKNRAGDLVKLVTELPSQNPTGVRVHYRVNKVTRSIIQKTQNIWRLSDTKLKHLDDIFLKADWHLKEIPGPVYKEGQNNPFVNFASIPGVIRARFMQENSRLIVGAMVQGMVCIGSTATYAIADHFWAWFLKPSMDPSAVNPTLGLETENILNTNPEEWKPSNLAEREFLKAAQLLDLANQKIAKRLINDYRKVLKFTGFESSPENGADDMLSEMVTELHKHKLRTGEILGAVHHFMRTTKANRAYHEAFERQLRLLYKAKKGSTALTFNELWTGDGEPTYPGKDDPNAWLNITRHERNTSVQFGPDGGIPQSIWIMSYSNFERLYYNLVSEYKAWGNLTHKMATWRHMSYIRLEGEDLAISMLPIKQRDEVRDWFARGLGGLKNKLFMPLFSKQDMFTKNPSLFDLRKHWNGPDLLARVDGEPSLSAATATETVHNYVTALTKRFKHVSDRALIHDELASDEQRIWEKELTALANRSEEKQKETFAQFMPNTTFIRVEGPEQKYWVYTIQADREYKSHNLMLLQNPNRDPKGDTLAVYRGFVGAYPEVFLDVKAADRNQLEQEISQLRSERDYEVLRAKYGVRRNLNNFWTFFDWVHAEKAKDFPGNDPVEQGVVDLSQYQFFN